MRKTFTTLIIFIFVLGLFPVNFSNAIGIATRLKGRILLQVESNGEAWYINPNNEKRYYLGRPANAFQVMRELGLGISDNDFDSFNGYAPNRLSGKILLKVEDNGKAYYVNPVDLKMHYLGRPADAFQVMRKLGLGISNGDLNSIEQETDYIINNQLDALKKEIESLKNQLDENNAQNTSDNTEEKLSLSEIVKQWRPRIANINCEWKYTNNNQTYLEASGSGIIFRENNSTVPNADIYILTNKHVITYLNQYTPKTCKIELPEMGTEFIIIDEGDDYAFRASKGDYDWGLIVAFSPNSYMEQTTKELNKCKNKPDIGDSIVILGYPGIGSQGDITATEGIISGYDDDYYITSAKIEHGNSGGAAILLKDNCYLGIPTYTISGEVESLARILSNDLIGK